MNIENLCSWSSGIASRYFVTLADGSEVDTDCDGYELLSGALCMFKRTANDGRRTGHYRVYAEGSWSNIRWGEPTDPETAKP